MLRGILVLLASFACSGEPKRSYCESLCDWAVACHETERTVDSAALLDQCLADTRASDASCEKAESGKMDPASAKLLEPCVKAIDANTEALECNGFVGSIEQLKVATVPAACATQSADAVATFDAARDATVETGEQLCNRYTTTFCERSADCILGDFQGEIPQEAIDAVGGTPFELCVQQLDQAFTNDCVANDLYAAEESLTDANLARQASRTCLTEFDAISCDQLFSGDLSNETGACAGSVSDPDDLVKIATALFELSEQFAEYAP
jgi:hypothetical protein